mmetsp:Transcript_428/g.567  ORF Transcript_428/g.567 Transcript_428/m.567 type:complete len:90 (+) Transcript_428:333-602(+)
MSCHHPRANTHGSAASAIIAEVNTDGVRLAARERRVGAAVGTLGVVVGDPVGSGTVPESRKKSSIAEEKSVGHAMWRSAPLTKVQSPTP